MGRFVRVVGHCSACDFNALYPAPTSMFRQQRAINVIHRLDQFLLWGYVAVSHIVCSPSVPHFKGKMDSIYPSKF